MKWLVSISLIGLLGLVVFGFMLGSAEEVSPCACSGDDGQLHSSEECDELAIWEYSIT